MPGRCREVGHELPESLMSRLLMCTSQEIAERKLFHVLLVFLLTLNGFLGFSFACSFFFVLFSQLPQMKRR